ncbi:hypothetical protein [Krasilnikovia sp. MM14-A1004]|uniref:hypothetical protein n=1 Tax=Krasilnikovia sp. MM14-A1004 TaxID=3373541 RepID=UPI00399CF06F
MHQLWDALVTGTGVGPPAAAWTPLWQAMSAGSFPAPLAARPRRSTLAPTGVPLELSVSETADGQIRVRATTEPYADATTLAERVRRQAGQLEAVAAAAGIGHALAHHLARSLPAAADLVTDRGRFGLWYSVGYGGVTPRAAGPVPVSARGKSTHGAAASLPVSARRRSTRGAAAPVPTPTRGGREPDVLKVYLPPNFGPTPAADLVPPPVAPLVRALLGRLSPSPVATRAAVVGLVARRSGRITVKAYHRVRQPMSAVEALDLLPGARGRPELYAALAGALPLAERGAVLGVEAPLGGDSAPVTTLYLPTAPLDPPTLGAGAVQRLATALGVPGGALKTAVSLAGHRAVPTMVGIRLAGVATLTYYFTAAVPRPVPTWSRRRT